jgi:hypothetical protein
MLLVSLILAVVGLVALVAAVITNNEMIAWVCIGASSLGVILLIVDAIRERTVQPPPGDLTASDDANTPPFVADADATDVIESDVVYSTDVIESDVAETDIVETEDYPEELVHDEPEFDMPDDDEPEYAEPAEEAAMHVLDEQPEPDR